MKADSRKTARGARAPGGKKAARPSASVTSRKRLLQVGLNAFSLPGAESAMTDGLSKLADSLGFKKLEGVFDQRVAGALIRLGYPSPLELRRLLAQSEQPNRSPGRRKVAR